MKNKYIILKEIITELEAIELIASKSIRNDGCFYGAAPAGMKERPGSTKRGYRIQREIEPVTFRYEIFPQRRVKYLTTPKLEELYDELDAPYMGPADRAGWKGIKSWFLSVAGKN
jgi:hypothetical protein